MHSHEDKVRMIELYLRYNRSATPVTNDPGYPNRRILRLWHRKFEGSRDTTSRYLKIGRPPTEVNCAARRKQRTRPLRIASKPRIPQSAPQTPPEPTAAIPKQHPNPHQQHPPSQQAAPRQAVPNSPPQTTKQSRACVRNIAWNGNCLPRPKNHQNSSTTCGFSFILQSLK